jgi:hypothetical protein
MTERLRVFRTPKHTLEELKELLSYDHKTGIFVWKQDRGTNRLAGRIAGRSSAGGYRMIKVSNMDYLAHRLAWWFHYGVLPSKIMDHINGIKHDNRICNLRETSDSENAQNILRARKHNTSGFLGVSLLKDRMKWEARIVVNKKRTRIGVFDTPEAAHSAYLAMKRELHKTAYLSTGGAHE